MGEIIFRTIIIIIEIILLVIIVKIDSDIDNKIVEMEELNIKLRQSIEKERKNDRR